MNLFMIMAVISIAIPVWQLVDKADKGDISGAVGAAVQVIALSIMFGQMG